MVFDRVCLIRLAWGLCVEAEDAAGKRGSACRRHIAEGVGGVLAADVRPDEYQDNRHEDGQDNGPEDRDGDHLAVTRGEIPAVAGWFRRSGSLSINWLVAPMTGACADALR